MIKHMQLFVALLMMPIVVVSSQCDESERIDLRDLARKDLENFKFTGVRCEFDPAAWAEPSFEARQNAIVSAVCYTACKHNNCKDLINDLLCFYQNDKPDPMLKRVIIAGQDQSTNRTCVIPLMEVLANNFSRALDPDYFEARLVRSGSPIKISQD